MFTDERTDDSPEYNPDEHLNNDLKQTIGSQRQARTEDDLLANTAAFMTSLAGDTDHVIACFDYPVLEPYR